MRTSLLVGAGVGFLGSVRASIVNRTLVAAPLTRQAWKSTWRPAREKAWTTSSAPKVPEPARSLPVAWSKAARSQSAFSPPFRRAVKKDVVDGVHDVVVTPGPDSRFVAQSLRWTAVGELREALLAGAATAGGARSAREAAASAASAGRGLIRAGNV